MRLGAVRFVLAAVVWCGPASHALAQAPKSPSPLSGPNWGGQVTDAVPPPAPASTASLKSLGSDRLRISVDFMGGYGFDGPKPTLGFEQQGRVAYAIFTARGVLNPRFSYVISMNPVNEIDPLPGCGAAGFFFPNDPTFLYGPGTTIDCQPSNGDRRVDSYRSVALDVTPQQGALREAYFDVRTPVGIRFGRTRLPMGFDWQESGSFSAKDATRIQRIDTRTSFGALFSYVKTRSGHDRPLLTGTVGAYAPGGNRYLDYNYYYFNDSSLNANSSPSYLGAASFVPIDAIEVRVAYQYGTTGSKVERLPSYWASKRNDDALVLSVAVRPTRFLRIFAEKANYTWGPTRTSAEMLGVDPTPIHKNGYYVTGEAWWPVRSTLTIGGSVSVERVDRADSLVRYAIEQGLFGVEPGRRDGMTVVRGYVDFSQFVRFGVYKVWDDNPYPWLSGIWPVTGPQAFTGKVTNTWGMMVRLLVK